MTKTLDIEGSDISLKMIEADVSTANFSFKTVADFITRKSRSFCDQLRLSYEFLTVDPSEWESCGNYQAAADFVRTMKVVNDAAEHGV